MRSTKSQISRLGKKIADLPKAAAAAAQLSFDRSADELAGLIRRLAPEDTGALKDSIAVTRGGETTPSFSQPGGATLVPEPGAMVTAGNNDVRYPHLVEFGTAAAPAQPFFFPAWNLLKGRIAKRTRRDVLAAMRREWEK